MRAAAVVLLSVMLIGCDPVPKQTVAERAAMEIETNEALTISHLRSMVSAQIQAKSLNIVDTDEDGRGEFLFLDELSGARPTRAPGKGLRIPLLMDAFKHRGAGGFVEVHGYLYRLFLPGPDGTPVDGKEADPAGSALRWCCYAWPVEYGRSGRRSFYVDESGTVRGEELPGLSGAHAPEADGKAAVWAPCGAGNG